MNRLSSNDLKATCDPSLFECDTTQDLEPFEEIIGQKRAEKSMNFGLKVKQKGYNIFMAGKTGTGKTTYAKNYINQEAEDKPVPDDWCYVYNFENPEVPKAINLPSGSVLTFKKDMKEFIEQLKNEIPTALESEDFEEQKKEINKKYQEKSNSIMSDFKSELREEGFSLQKTPQGISPVPLKDGEPMQQEDFQDLPEEKREEFLEKGQKAKAELDDVMRKVEKIKTKAKEEIEELEKKVVLSYIQPLIEDLKSRYEDNEKIGNYLGQVQDDLMDNIDKFKEDDNGQKLPQLMQAKKQMDQSFFNRYKVNLLINNKDTEGAPVVIETNPTYYNLFGKIEGKSQFGAIKTDFTMIKSGAFHEANGGYLILQAKDLLSNPLAWKALKRTLANQEIRLENIGEQYRTVPTKSLKPETIPLDIKVVLIGNPFIYQLLYQADEDFKKLFKIKADFDDVMNKSEKNLKKFACFISGLCDRDDLKHFSNKAIAHVVEYSSRLAGNKDKLTTKFNEIIEILYEADTWADIEDAEYVEKEHIQKAIEEKMFRSNLSEEKIHEMIEKDRILIDADGETTGQINGLAVYQTGQYSFGRPSRITCQTYMGKKGVTNIEREAEMSGKIHNKAVLILSGYLGGKYAKDKPLTLSASLAFEQNYGGVDGDSASCAELIALLSAIADLPIWQDTAITGSMNQKGQVQPIGGVNEKIEGFFKVCKEKGLTGDQGVVIPEQNVENLMLKDEVIEAVEGDQFNIYSVKEIDEAIEIMLDKDPAEVHQDVDDKLKELAEQADKFSKKEDE